MKTTLNLCTLLAVSGLLFTNSSAMAADHVSTSPPFWTFLAPPPAGKTQLIRSPNGLTANFKTTGLSAGHAVTLWIMFFDNPGACLTPGACDPDVDIGRDGVRFDFHYAGGHIVNSAKTTISGHLRVGETSTSGWAELAAIGGAPAAFITPLTNPYGAQVILALHSHGPMQRGKNLAAQLSSYLGGCNLPFLGNLAGFAQSSDDIPANEGECSTIQLAFHSPAAD
jgi:hypothetical protein